MLPRRFGIRRPCLLETDQEKHRRRLAVETLIDSIARECLTDDERYELFKKYARRPTRIPNWEIRRLLVAAMDAEPNTSASALGKRLYQKHGRKAGQSPDAIAQHIRRVKKEREKQHRFLSRMRSKSLLNSIDPTNS